MSQKFYSDIEARAGLMDSSGALGTSGQILSSTGSNVSWINQSTAANDVQNRVKAGVAINKGQAVYVTGADGTNIIVGLASNASEATSSKTLGLLNATVAINGMADVVQIGRLSGLNTLGATAGDPVWLGTGGNLIYGLIGKPYAPANLVFIGIVTRVNVSNGEIFVNVQNGFELNEIHDVDLKTNVPINGDVLGFNGTLWVNKTIAGWLGYTPANASGTTNYVSKFTGATTLGNSLLFDNGTNVGIGTTSPGSKLDVSSGNINLSNSFNLTARNNANTFNIALIGRSSTDRVIIDADGYGTNIGGGGTVLINPTGGNVGIGTTSPTASAGYNTLSVNGSSGGQITLQTGNAIKGYIYNTSTSLVVGADLGNALVLDAGNTERMRITSGGNVGIGTSSAFSKVEIAGAATGWSNSPAITFTDNAGTVNSRRWLIGNVATDYGSLNFAVSTTNSDNPTNPKMTITKEGNVGIGTTSPQGKLSVDGGNIRFNYGNDANSYYLYLNHNSSYDGGMLWTRDNSTFDWQINNLGANGDLSFYSYGTGSPAFVLQRSSGNVGIGTTNTFGWKTFINSGSSSSTLLLGSSTVGTYIALNDNNSTVAPRIGGITNDLVFTTSNIERMRIASNGAIKFNAYGSGTFTGTATQKLAVDSSGNIIEIPIGAGPVDGSGTTNYVTKWTDADTIGNSIMYDNGNRVGIGSSTPAAKLEIFGGVLGSTAYDYAPTQVLSVGNTNGEAFEMGSIRTSAGSDWTTAGFRLQEKIDSTWMAYMQFNGDGNLGGMSFGTGTSSTSRQSISERMRINSNGNVGIGTTSPATKLEVSGIASFTGSGGRSVVIEGQGAGRIDINGDGSAYAVGIKFNSSPGGTALSGIWNYGSGTSQQWLAIGGTAYNNAALYTLPSGDVGIGTTSTSSYKLYVNGGQYGTYLRGGDLGTGSIALNVVKNDFSSALLVRGDGNVGIGTTSPSQKLTIGNGTGTGNQYVRINSSSADIYIGQSVGTLFGIAANSSQLIVGDNASYPLVIGTTGSQPFIFGTTNAERMRITSSGTLQVSTGDIFGGNLASDYGSLTLRGGYGATTGSASKVEIRGYEGGGGTQGAIISYTNGTERMRIMQGGNVGIGTSSPSYKLQVNDTIATVTGFGSFTALQSAAGTGFRWTLNNDGTFRVQKTADGFFNISATPIMIDSSNRVGIGTTAPQRDLQVGAFSGSPEICIGSSTTGNGTLAFGDGATGNDPWRGYVQYNHSVDAMIFGTVNGEKVRITSAGYMGIGTTAPSYPLYVGIQVSNVSIYADYDIVAFSDQSVKENIRPIENALERVIESRGVLYDRIDSGEKDNIGFIAQELEVAFPELVVTNEDGTKAVKYQNAVAVLFEAVKEQQKQIDEIKRILNGITN